MPRPAAVVVLAAGEGTRMRSATPKVLHQVAGRPMLAHVLAAAAALDAQQVVVVVGSGRDQVTAALPEGVRAVVQEEQRGTGHAVRTALAALGRVDGTVVVLPGDAPLLRGDLLLRLVDAHEAAGAATTLLTARVPDPTGYGRVVRDGDAVLRVVEHKDADDDERRIDEVGTSVYAFAGGPLREALGRLSTDNAQGEEYLTDVIGLHVAAGLVVTAVVADDAEATEGVNDRVQLAVAGRRLNDRLVAAAMRGGTTVVDPATTWLGVDVVLEPDTTLLPGTRLSGRTVVRRGAVVGPDATLEDTEVGEGAVVRSSTCTGAVVGPAASVGPYAYLRPGTVLERGAKAGTFVEVKNSVVGAGSKVPHLSYVGDATIGERTNIGAGTIVFNYDGFAKHRTTIGDDAKVGGHNSLVAPVVIGDGAFTGANAVIKEDVPPGALAVSENTQRTIEGWAQRRAARLQGESS